MTVRFRGDGSASDPDGFAQRAGVSRTTASFVMTGRRVHVCAPATGATRRRRSVVTPTASVLRTKSVSTDDKSVRDTPRAGNARRPSMISIRAPGMDAPGDLGLARPAAPCPRLPHITQVGMFRREIGTVGHGHHLAAPVDDGAQHVQERVRAPADRACRPARTARRQFGRAGQAVAAVCPTHRGIGRPPGSRRRSCCGTSTGPAPGRVSATQHRIDPAAETAGGHEHQPLGVLRELVGELHGDAAAEAVPDHRHPVDARARQQVAHPVGVTAERVVGSRLVRCAVAEQIRRDDGESAGELSMTGDQVV